LGSEMEDHKHRVQLPGLQRMYIMMQKMQTLHKFL
jgi:hypothetical protein